MLFKIILFLVIVGALAYHRVSLKIWSGTIFVLLLAYTFLSHASIWSLTFLWLLFAIFILPISFVPIRRKFITRKIFNLYRQLMPKMSQTEREALEAGDVSFEAELFNGKPDWKKLADITPAKLTAEEKAFIEGPVEQLCAMVNDWKISHELTDLPPEMWQFLKDKGFFGLSVPKQYGGKEFSALAHAEIISKVYSVSVSLGTTVSVPNSLGPAELILHYGTQEQKDYYLPRLAKGEEFPCFALTGPDAGSDAGSIPDKGIVCRGEFEGKEVLGIRLNWNKRYITFSPRATVLGLAFKLFDPEKLIGDEVERGITCALIPTKLEGISIGRRHFPLNAAFLNGPTQGKDVFVPIDFIIGGQQMAGQGWRMLVECLSVGRAISLPCSGIGGGKMAVFATGAYSRIRRQFNLPIGKFEGVSEALSRMVGWVYMMDAAKNLTMSIIHQGHKPSVLSAIMKYHLTELSRKISCDAMDVHGGKAICLGPNNYLGRFYQSIPIAITVEGANILTRSLIIFGQGAIRCHQYVVEELQAGSDNNLKRFDRAFWGHVGLVVSNVFRSFFLGLTNAYFVKNPVLTTTTKRYYQLLTRFSSVFSLVADFAMLSLGAELKRKERLSARLGDVLSYLYLITATLKRYEDDGRLVADLPIVYWICQTYFFEIQSALDAILQNLPSKGLGLLLRVLVFPLGKCMKRPTDKLSQQLTDVIYEPGEARDRLTNNVYKGGLMAQLEDAFVKMVRVEHLWKKENLTAEEEALLKEADEARKKVIAVDDFSHEELAR